MHVLIQVPGLADCGNKPRANVVSISYSTGADFNDPTDPSSAQLLQLQCAEIGKVRTFNPSRRRP